MIENKIYYVEQLNSSKAYQFTSAYHYSGIGFKKAKINLGVYRKVDNLLVGVLQWGISAQEGIRLDRYVKEPITKEQYLELNRFCMADSEGKNAESQAISLGIKWIKKNRPDIKLLVSYAGRVEGNYGYIYQATNWEYLGYFISPGFWKVDDKERHQITIWSYYKKHGDQNKPFREAICDLFHTVIQTWTKQFIYIQRLDKSLTPASEILPYPKETTEAPICTKVKVYKEEPFTPTEAKERVAPEFYYTPGEDLFSRRALNRHGVKHRERIAVYDKNGDFEFDAETITDVAKELEITNASVSKGLKTEKLTCGYFFRHFTTDEPADTIDIPWLCEIDGVRFVKQGDIADYCEVTKQAISLSVKRKSKVINGKTILWKD